MEINKEFYRKVLDNLYDRRYVEMNLIGKLEELQRYGRSFAVLFIDIDHFKIINDFSNVHKDLTKEKRAKQIYHFEIEISI